MRHQTVSVVLVALLASGAAAACASSPSRTTTPPGAPAGSVAAPPSPPSSVSRAAAGRFVLLQGSDTVGVERFDRTADRLRAELTARGTVAYRFDASLAPDASVSRIQLTVRPPSGGELTSTATFAGDSVVLTRNASGDSAQHATRTAARGSVPFVNPSPSLMEQIVRRARAMGGTTAAVPVFVGGAGPANVSATVTFTARDSAQLDIGGVAVLLRVDPAGAILGGSVPPQRLTITRVE